MSFRDDFKSYWNAAREEARRAADQVFGDAGKRPDDVLELFRPRVADRPGLRFLEPLVAAGAGVALMVLGTAALGALAILLGALIAIGLILRFAFGVQIDMDPTAFRWSF